MSKSNFSWWSGIALATMMAQPAFAFVQPSSSNELKSANLPGEQVIRPDTVSIAPQSHLSLQSLSLNAVEKDQLTGAIRLLEGPLGLPVEKFTEACLSFIDEHQDLFGVKSADLILNADAMLVDKEDQFLKFSVSRDGLVIADAGMDCRFKFGKLVQVVNQSFAEASVDKASLPSISVAAMKEVLSQYDLQVTSTPEYLYRVVLGVKGYELRKVARFSTLAGDVPFFTSVDVASGQVFEHKSKHHDVDIQGAATTSYYERNYNDDVEVAPYNLGRIYADTRRFDTSAEGAFSAPDDVNLALKGFDGARVKVSVRTGSLVNTTAQKVGDAWTLDYVPSASAARESDKAMAQAMVYFHVNRIVDFASRFIQPSWFDRTLSAYTNQSSTCNAFWNGSSINFYSAGSGCANTALISDVIYHEWGHGLDANTGGISDSAFSEGFGDIMALLFNRDSVVAPGFRTDGRGIRDLAPNKVYPRDRGEVHAEGLIIGGTFFDMFEMFSAQVSEDAAIELLAKYAFKGIYAARRYTDMYNALKIIDDDDGDTATMSPNFCVINKAFTTHGLATADSRCAESL